MKKGPPRRSFLFKTALSSVESEQLQRRA
ncbi:MAG: hypothetical protein RJA19_1018, partial [Bacteroidota bacterium]